MAKRKEYTTKLFLGGYKTKLYDDEGRRAEGVGNTKEESIKRAYKQWREKYGKM